MISAVTESAFASRRESDWRTLEELSTRAGAQGLRALTPPEVVQVAPLYRDACADLARAQSSRYSAPLVQYLQWLTATAHGILYGARALTWERNHVGASDSAVRGFRAAYEAFPRKVRAHHRPILLAALLFFGPLIVGAVAALLHPSFAFRVASEAMLRPLTEAYAKGFAEGRHVGQGATMAGFYVNNNVGIALRCFALGIFGGIGSVFFLIQNGLSTGAILGYVASQGAGANIVTFIVGHGSLELGAIVIAGGAGLSLGWSVIAPGNRTRVASLQTAGREVVVLVAGAAAMLLLAAGVEAFWSGSSIPSAIKRAIGLFAFLGMIAYLALVGRASGRRERR